MGNYMIPTYINFVSESCIEWISCVREESDDVPQTADLKLLRFSLYHLPETIEKLSIPFMKLQWYHRLKLANKH